MLPVTTRLAPGAIGFSSIVAAYLRRQSTTETLAAGLRARAALCGTAFLFAQQLDWASISRRTTNIESTMRTGDETNAGAGAGGEGQAGKGTKKTTAAGEEEPASVPLGQLSELMSKSAESVLHYFEARVILMLLPFEMIASIAILYVFVGVAGLGGLSTLLVVLFFSHVAGKHIEAASLRKSAALGSFTSGITETLTGIMTIKLSGWTETFRGTCRPARCQQQE